MNSVLEYVRQLNQHSVTLRNEWLDRLRHVECEPAVFSLTPEICLTKRPALRSSDSSTHSAPITVVPPDPFGFGQQEKADKITRQSAIVANSVAPINSSIDSANQSGTVPQKPDSQVENGAVSSWNIAAAPTVATLHESLTTFSESVTSPGGGHPGFPDTNIPVDSSINQMDAKPVDELSTSLLRPFDKIAVQLLARFPLMSSATVMFASLNPGIDVDTVAAKVATCLANRDLGGILLIDGNTSSRELSKLMGTARSPGLMELVNQTDTLSNVVRSTDNGNLAFLPYGKGDFTHRRFDANRATALGKEFNEVFQYTIVSGGVVDNSLVQRWSGFVDAVYLLIDLGCADRQKTIESLAALRHQAVRIAGIITVAKQ